MTALQDSVWSDDVNTQTGTSYTLVLSDSGKQVTMSNAGASTLTIPPNASVAFVVGVRIQIIQLGAGVVTLTAGAGVTLVKPNVPLTMTQNQIATLVKTASNTWAVSFSAGGTLSSLSVTGAVTAGSFAGALTGNVTGNVSGSSGSTTGNAATASSVALSGVSGLVCSAQVVTLNASRQGTFSHGFGATPTGVILTNGDLSSNGGFPAVISVSSTQVNFESVGGAPGSYRINYIIY